MEYLPWFFFGGIAILIFLLWAISFRFHLKADESDRQRLERKHYD